MQYAVLESTSHGLAQHRVTGSEYDVAVVTNITHEHLDYHGTYEAYRDAKAMLFRALTHGAAQAGHAQGGRAEPRRQLLRLSARPSPPTCS